jgi:putative CocE/NonD family hydrolase
MRTTAWLVAAATLLAAAVVAWAPLRRIVTERLPVRWQIAISAWRHSVSVDHGVIIAMRDGKRLAASLYRPAASSGPLATVLVRLPYHRLKYGEGYNAGLFFARAGYAVVVQDLRGTGDSEGELLPWRDAAEDGIDTLDWIVKQGWSNGRVGTFGCSALGETQLVLAASNHPAHRAMIPSGAGGAVGQAAGRYGYFGLFEGGVFQLASGFGWFVDSGSKDPMAAPASRFDRAEHLRRLPVDSLVTAVRPAPNGYADYLATPLHDPQWARWGFLGDADRSDVPALIINAWGDQTVGDTLALAESWRRSGLGRARTQKVVIAPASHCHHEEAAAQDRFGEIAITNAGRPYQDWYLRWFDHWLRDKPDDFADIAAYNVFVLGEDTWLRSDQWPPEQARVQRWYLSGGGHANTGSGDGTLQPAGADLRSGVDSYVYDPANPVPSRGGPICCTGNDRDRPGPADQGDVESRADVLVYTSAPLGTDLRIAGPLTLNLSFASSAADTDIVARLVHVWPDGRATGIQEGALRLRYRGGFERPQLMQPGQRYDIRVDLRSIAYRLPEGHRLRLHVTSSSFPRLERNLNTGAANNAAETRIAIATNTVHFGAGSASYLELPVLDALAGAR